jgi:hypothetical protein
MRVLQRLRTVPALTQVKRRCGDSPEQAGQKRALRALNGRRPALQGLCNESSFPMATTYPDRHPGAGRDPVATTLARTVRLLDDQTFVC